MSMCDGVDSWDHMIHCKFYDTKWNPKWIMKNRISQEQLIKVKMPLIWKLQQITYNFQIQIV